MFKYILIPLLFLSCKKESSCPHYEDRWKESLALIIQAECSNCTFEEKAMVGAVVMFRLYSPDFPKNIDSIIQEKNAFHGYLQEQYCYNRESYEIAEKLIEHRFEYMLIMEGKKSDIVNIKPILYFWRNNQDKPKYVKEIIYKMPYHNFGI